MIQFLVACTHKMAEFEKDAKYLPLMRFGVYSGPVSTNVIESESSTRIQIRSNKTIKAAAFLERYALFNVYY
jgi:hypothetical protein